MPYKQPDVWAAIWSWINTNIGNQYVTGVLAAITMAILRACFLRTKKRLIFKVIDALICGLLTYVSIPLLEHFCGHLDYANILGGAVGLLGTEQIRDFLIDWVSGKTKGSSNEDER
ncbi:phage holin, lambda family [Gallibacterium anatis]|uniref:phage holin, lambda family n=1 Tax=Gallibacterium anatis TaxID=750 RepID=UPI002670A483|nr:phage holin, lambda family [Gallibacterium anatis]WKS98324.1 phage holin, lambda family [Gallibacterium anatis]